jgi:hypothetical protein
MYVNGKNAIYYDSFGEEAPLEVINFCKKANVKILMNHFQIQDLLCTACGYYTLAFLHWMTKHKIPSQYYLNMFNKIFDFDTKKNLPILKKYIKSIVHK